MGKQLKLRIPLLLPCRPKSSSSSSFPVAPIPIKRQVSSPLESVGCGCRPKPKKPSTRYHYNTPKTPPRRKIYNSPLSGEENSDSHVSASPAFHKKPIQKTRFSNCSAEAAWSSSEETEPSGDSSTDSNYSSALSDLIAETPISGVIVKNKKKKKRGGNRVKRVKYYGNNKVYPVGKKVTYNTPETESPDKEKMTESLAVMKKSEDPYGDFRRSMMEMIVEREMFETNDLEQLLQCFLSLNSRHHYGVIIEAFSDIWEILFSKSTVT